MSPSGSTHRLVVTISVVDTIVPVLPLETSSPTVNAHAPPTASEPETR